MATILLPIGGRSALINRIAPGATFTISLATPAVDGAALEVSVSVADKNGNTETTPIAVITQAQIQSLLKPTGGSYNAAVEAALADLAADFNTRFNTLEVDVIAATGAGEQAAVTALLATGQTEIDTIIDDAVAAANAVFD